MALIIGMEWISKAGLENRAVVISATGRVLGYQTKNQITPGSESRHYMADGRRRVFRMGKLVFGIVICHEGWRYPESVRWAAVRGAHIVFQPQVTAGLKVERRSRKWGDSFYEKAMLCRAQENSIYFASANEAMRGSRWRTSLVDPRGEVVDYLPLGRGGLLAANINTDLASRRYARRYRPELYPS